jgi:hypothetical protein
VNAVGGVGCPENPFMKVSGGVFRLQALKVKELQPYPKNKISKNASKFKNKFILQNNKNITIPTIFTR